MKLTWILRIVILFLLLGGAAFWLAQPKSAYDKIVVKFLDEQDINFISEAEIIRLVQDGQDSTQSNLAWIEKKIRAFQFIKDCQVSRDLGGRLIIEIKQNRPLARLLFSSQASQGAYISETGELLPLSEHFTARVLLLTGEGTRRIQKDYFSKEGKNLYDFLLFIEKDEFWKAQITQIDIDKAGKLKLYTQIGEQEVSFGFADNFKEKLDKLYTFYRSIAPAKGWKSYRKIDVQYDKQIVCK